MKTAAFLVSNFINSRFSESAKILIKINKPKGWINVKTIISSIV